MDEPDNMGAASDRLRWQEKVRQMKDQSYDRAMKDDLREALRVEAFLRMLAFLQQLYIDIGELGGNNIREQAQKLVIDRVERVRHILAMDD